MWNRTKTVLATMILIAASLTIYFSIYLKTYVLTPTPDEEEKIEWWWHAWDFMPIPGQEVSLDQAKALVPFKINLPANMGAYTQLKLLQAPQTDTPVVYIIYTAHKLSGNASYYDVMKQDGVMLFEAPSEVSSPQNIRAAINSTKNDPGGGLQEVTINGYVGCAGGNVGHCVCWDTETTYYQLSANINYPLQQLLKIARSIPVDRSANE